MCAISLFLWHLFVTEISQVEARVGRWCLFHPLPQLSARMAASGREKPPAKWRPEVVRWIYEVLDSWDILYRTLSAGLTAVPLDCVYSQNTYYLFLHEVSQFLVWGWWELRGDGDTWYSWRPAPTRYIVDTQVRTTSCHSWELCCVVKKSLHTRWIPGMYRFFFSFVNRNEITVINVLTEYFQGHFSHVSPIRHFRL